MKRTDMLKRAVSFGERGEEMVRDKAEAMRDDLKEKIQERPYTAVMIAAGIGLLLGIVLRRRGHGPGIRPQGGLPLNRAKDRGAAGRKGSPAPGSKKGAPGKGRARKAPVGEGQRPGRGDRAAPADRPPAEGDGGAAVSA